MLLYCFILDSKEVKVFVEMMSIAAGESDFEVDRVAYFEASCQAFSPIIFDLNEDSGFCEFEKACKRTASAITADPKIIEKLVSNVATLLSYNQQMSNQLFERFFNQRSESQLMKIINF